MELAKGGAILDRFFTHAEQRRSSCQVDIAVLGADEVRGAPSVVFAVGARDLWEWGRKAAVIGILDVDGCGLRNDILRERNAIHLVGGGAGDVVAGLSGCCF